VPGNVVRKGSRRDCQLSLYPRWTLLLITVGADMPAASPAASKPAWASEVSEHIRAACLHLDADEHHILRNDVVETYPQFKEAYEKMCPRRTDLTAMAKKAATLGYVTAPPQPGRSGRAAAFVSSPDVALSAFLADCQLLHDNCVTFNGPQSAFAATAADMLKRAKAIVAHLREKFAGAATPTLNAVSREDVLEAAPPPQVASRPPVKAVPPVPKPSAAQAQPSALKVALGSAAAAAPTTGPSSLEQPRPPAPRLEPKARRPPRPESHPVPLTVPARLKAVVLSEYLQRSVDPSPAEAAVGATLWDNTADLSFSDEVEARVKRYPTTPTTCELLRDFEAEVSKDDDVDWVLHVASVVSRVIKPIFASTVFSAALYPSERADLLALVKYGVVVTGDGGPESTVEVVPGTCIRGCDLLNVFGARVLLRVLLYIPSASAGVLALHTRQPSDADGAVERGVVPVVSALLNFMDRNAHRLGLQPVAGERDAKDTKAS
jgi:hypothetical protein